LHQTAFQIHNNDAALLSCSFVRGREHVLYHFDRSKSAGTHVFSAKQVETVCILLSSVHFILELVVVDVQLFALNINHVDHPVTVNISELKRGLRLDLFASHKAIGVKPFQSCV
jgi:hypothetical protein